MYKWFTVLAVAVMFSAPAMAISTVEIETVGKKAVLDQADMAKIDAFVAGAVEEIITTEDFSNIAEVRAAVMANSKSSQAQFKPAFDAAVAKYVPQGLKKAQSISNEQQKNNAMLNIMILIDSLRDPALIDSVAGMLDSDNVAMRYWAARSITSLAVDNPKAAQLGLSKFPAMLGKETSGDVLEQVARFGSTAKASGAKKLLFDVADMRIKSYKDWSASNFDLDGTILSLLGNHVNAGTENDPAAARFAQLFGYMLQRYCDDSNLTKAQKQALAAVLVQTEAGALAKVGIPQTTIKKAITEKGGMASIVLVEYKSLYGEDGKSGKINTTLNVKNVEQLPAKPVTIAK